MLFGRMLDPVHQREAPSVDLLYLIATGNAAATALSPPQHFVDVQDSAALHVAALTFSDVCNQRLFAVTAPYNINSMLSLLRGLYPNRVFSGDVSDHGVDLSEFVEDRRPSELLLRMGLQERTLLSTSVRNTCDDLF